MTQLSVAPQQPPMLAPQQSAPAPGAEANSTAPADEGADFASVLGQHISVPAKPAAEAENIAATLPAPSAETTDGALALGAALPVAPDLVSLMMILAGQIVQESKAAPADHIAMDESGNESGVQALPGITAEAPLPPQATPLQLAASAAPGPQVLATADATAVATQPKSVPALPSQATSVASAEPLHEASAPPIWQGGAFVQTEPSDAASAAKAEASAAPMSAAAEQADPLAASRGMHAAAAVATARESRETLRIETPVGARGWDSEVANKIVLLAGREEGRAELTLTPPQLGRVEITISVQGDQTSAAFVSANPVAREALEQALPRLREILAEAGITLGQASVNAESARQGRDDAPAQDAGDGRSRESARSSGAAPAPWVRRSVGLIDTFA